MRVTHAYERLEKELKDVHRKLTEMGVPEEVHVEGGMAFTSLAARIQWLNDHLQERERICRERLRELAHQVRISNAVDDHGHELKHLKALADAEKLLGGE